MRSLLHIFIVISTVLIVVGYSHFVPRKDKVHLGRMANSRRWDRWCESDYQCGRGFCRGYSCQCYRGYITWSYMGYMDVCTYQQRKKLTAFLVSFFVGIFGIDWFVLSQGTAGYIIAGIIKLLISLGCILGWPVTIFSISEKKPDRVPLAKIITVILSVASFIWWLTDWIRILADVFRDGYGAPLEPWSYYTYFESGSYRA